MKFTRKYRRKMFWPIGLINLVIISFVFFRYMATNPGFHNQQTMEIIFATQRLFDYIKAENPDEVIPPAGNWFLYKFFDNDSANLAQLANLRRHVRTFMSLRGKDIGIHVSLNRQMSYNIFVQIVDMLNLENVTRFSFTGSDIWIHSFLLPKKSKLDDIKFFVCGGVRVLDPPPLTWPQRLKSTIDEFKFYWDYVIRQLPISIVSIWLMVFSLNIYQVYKYGRINSIRYINSRFS